MTAGMAYEAMNHMGGLNKRLIVILNDNDMSIAPPVGALSHYLSKTVSSKGYRQLRKAGKMVAKTVGLEKPAKKAEHYARDFALGGALFDSLGFYYVGPIDGHDMNMLTTVLENARDMQNGPVLVHVVTEKGKGFAPAEAASDKYHGVSKFNVVTGEQAKAKPNAPSYTSIFANEIIRLAEDDESIVGITAAMPSGTGMDKFGDRFPERMFDVGIAEQHAVTMAAALAADGMKPFCAIYSTFLQRAYDSVVHDVAIQKLPVRFAIDRAGLVGADGPTHAGSFDIGYLGALPHFVLMGAADEADLQRMVATSHAIDDCPSAFRYPRGEGIGVDLWDRAEPLEIGKGRIMREGTTVAILSFGGRMKEALLAAEMLGAQGLSTTVADARFAKPLDEALIARLASEHEVLITVEEGAIGGFGGFVLQHLAMTGRLDAGLKIRTLQLPDEFIDQDKPEKMYEQAGLSARDIAAAAIQALGRGDCKKLHLVAG